MPSSNRCQPLAETIVVHTTHLCAQPGNARLSPEVSAGFSTRATPSQQAICRNTPRAAGEMTSLRQRTRPIMQMMCDAQRSRGSWIRNQSRRHSNGRGKGRFIILTGNTQLPKRGMHPMSYANAVDGEIELRFSGPRSFDGSVRISTLSTLLVTEGFNR